MARAWRGSISFGLVNIPVALLTAETQDKVHFHMLDKHDRSPIRYQVVNKNTDKVVDRKDIIKGYEFEEDNYVELTADDLKKANMKATQTIEIDAFVKREEINPIYFYKPYFIEPQKKSEKSYALLRAVLEQTNKVAVATVVIQTKQHLAVIMAQGDVLILELLRFSHEIKSADDVNVPSGNLKALGLKPAEIKMAESLVAEMSEDWKPEKYHDKYQEDLKRFIQNKIKAGKTGRAPAPSDDGEDAEESKASTGNVVDFVGLLKRSLKNRETGKRPKHGA